MKNTRIQFLEEIQKLVVKTIATSRVGINLSLIGGFRFRLLDNSPRISVDIDYHWPGNLEDKQRELVSLFQRKLLPSIKEKWDYDGKVSERICPDRDLPGTRTVDLAFYKMGVLYSRIEMSVDITRIECEDNPVPITREGTVFLTVSDGDMIESKIIALFNRIYVQERDILDIFLFREKLEPDSKERIAGKMEHLSLDKSLVAKRFEKIKTDRDYHIRRMNFIIEEFFDPSAVENIHMGGGARIVFDHVMETLEEILPKPGG